MTLRLVARGIAFAIAIAGVLDPAIISTRPARPVVSVVATGTAANDAVVDRVLATLGNRFVILDAPFEAADATILVGDRLPEGSTSPTTPVFAVVPDLASPTLRIERFVVPAWVPLESRVPITVGARVTGAAGRRVTVSLLVGALEIDRVEHNVRTADERFGARVAFVPTAAGASLLRIVARIDGEPANAVADALVDVRDERLAVLFHDARPSWMSTFVRRAIERDPRFAVASRTITSRDISTDAGQPPTLGDAASLERFDAIVVGAPESLTEREIAGLETWMRRRGGGVILLFDRNADGPYRRLTGIDELSAQTADTGEPVDAATHGEPVAPDDGPPALRAAETLSPAPLPAGARTIAVRRATQDTDALPVIWRSAVGAGRLLSSGALDAWRFRDPSVSAFDEFWRATVAEIAAATPAGIDIRIADPVTPPGGSVDVVVTLPGLLLSDPVAGDTVRTTISAVLEGPDGSRGIRLWPEGAPGRFRGVIDAPNEPGDWRVSVSSGNTEEADAAVVVVADPARARPDQRDLVVAWARAHGGDAFQYARLDALPAALMAALAPAPRRVPWYPMRSAWWIVPFVLTLGAEWWLRRRRGLA